MASNFRKFKNPEPIVPGRKVDMQLGGTGQNPALKRIYQLLRELEDVKSEIGDVDVETTPATANDILVFNGTAWTPIDKTALLSLTQLTDVVLVAPASNDLLRFDGSNWVNTPLSGLISLHDLSDVTLSTPSTGAFLVKTAGDWIDQNFSPGKLGIGTTLDPTHRLELEDGDYTGWYTGSASNLKSGARGFHLNKAKTRALPNAITWHTDGWANWEVGMDFDTNNSLSSGFGNADFVPAFDHSADSNAGADVIRISPEEASSVSDTCKIAMGRLVGTPRDNVYFLTLDGGDDATELGGMNVRFYGGSSASALGLVQRNTGNNRVMLSFGDTSETFWTMGTDAGAANDKHLYFFDNVNSKTRIMVRNNTALLASVGFGTASPQAVAHLAGSADASLADTVQRYLHASTTSDPANRGINIENIRGGSGISNYLFLNGGLGAGSTSATRVTTSTFALAWGLECRDSELSMISAPAGTNQTITRLLRFDSSGGVYRFGVFGVTPQARTTAYTQTYSTADRTHAAPTAAALTHAVGTADGTVDDVGAAFDQTTLNNNFKELTDQIGKLVADVADVKQLANSMIDDLQGYGLFQ